MVLSDGLLDHFTTLCEGAAPLQEFLCASMEIPY